MHSLGIACVGAGNWGRNLVRHFDALSASRLIVCCDLNEDVLKDLSAQYVDVTLTRDYQRVLHDPSIDAIVLASPVEMHFPMAKQALEVGKHVFVEKPLALEVQEAEALCLMAEEKGLILMVGHLLEYHPAIQELKNLVDLGALGDIHYIYTQRVNFGIIRKNETALWSLGPHDVSMVCHLLNGQPQTVNARGMSCVQDGIEDVVFANLNFDDQVMAQIHVSWLDPHKIRRLTIVGSQRMAVFDDMEPVEKIRLYENYANHADIPGWERRARLHHGPVEVPEFDRSEPLKLECEHFLDCIRFGRRPISDGNDGLRVVRVLDAAQRSLESAGIPIRIKTAQPDA